MKKSNPVPACSRFTSRRPSQEYLRPVELVRRILATGPSLKCELPSVDASKMGQVLGFDVVVDGRRG